LLFLLFTAASFFVGLMISSLVRDRMLATEVARELARRIDAHQLIKFVEETGDMGRAERLLEEGRVEGAVVIPEGFEKDIVRGQGSDVTLELDTARFLVPTI
jgi:hypothetical protein